MVSLSYSSAIPSEAPPACLIVGEQANLQRIGFSDVESLISHRVSAKVFNEVLSDIGDSEGVCLYPKAVAIATLSSKRSRHTTPTAAHHVMDTVSKHLPKSGDSAVVVVVCLRQHVFACGSAVARAFPTYSLKTRDVTTRNVTVCFLTPDDKSPLSDQDIKVLSSTATAIRLAADIVDRPRNEMTCDDLVKCAVKIGQDLGVDVTVISGEQLKEQGFGGIYGVGKAAESPPALCVLSHKPPGASKTIAWCGKGIMYDTGGFSIKTKTGMPGMKRDCGGAAGILAAFKATVECGFSENLHAVLCIAENSVGPRAAVPDDIHILYSGKSVEINNTDAEGRLVLGDGVAYARKDLNADIVLDMCTLTGAQGITTGQHHAALLSNNAQWESCAVSAGLSSGDMLFPIVYAPELHFSEFKSSVADMKNSVANRSNAQSSCAGLFIGSHLFDDFSKPSPIVWLHIDMAYPVHVGERATGWGPALLLTLFGRYSTSGLLSNIAPVLPVDQASKRPKHDEMC
ncbi:hypothetical protein ACHWQZ_G007052 [Mnemiopsis leidyi]